MALKFVSYSGFKCHFTFSTNRFLQNIFNRRVAQMKRKEPQRCYIELQLSAKLCEKTRLFSALKYCISQQFDLSDETIHITRHNFCFHYLRNRNW